MNAIDAADDLKKDLVSITSEPIGKGLIQAAHTPQHFKRVETWLASLA